jgi:polyisoprenoid-binding protein YceI
MKTTLNRLGTKSTAWIIVVLAVSAHAALSQSSTNLPPGVIRYESVATGSSCELHGDCTTGKWTMNSAQMSGWMEVDESFPEGFAESKVTPKVGLRIPVKTLKSGTAAMDRKMESCMDAAKYPMIEYTLIQLKQTSPAGTKGVVAFDATGTLKIYGKTLTNSMPVTIEKKDGRLAVKGNYTVKMAEHGIPPCTFMLLTVYDPVDIKFNWLAAPKTKPALP